MKNIRLPYDLRDRAHACADEVQLPLVEWCRRAVKQCAGSVDGVAIPHEWRHTTRIDSVPVAVTLPANARNLGSEQIRNAIAHAVLYCEARRPQPFEPQTDFYEVVEAK